MAHALIARRKKDTTPIQTVTKRGFKKWLEGQPKTTRSWVESVGFRGEAGKSCLVPGRDGKLAKVLLGIGRGEPWAWSSLPTSLPAGSYAVEDDLDVTAADAASLGWALGAYEFTRYRKATRKPASLVWPDAARKRRVTAIAEGIALARDLINTPANDLLPTQLAEAVSTLAARHGASYGAIVGDKLLEDGYPAIHAVGRASADAPRLATLTWGDESHPKLTLVGKGVCFDSGGLDLKPPAGMKLMKKDMGGAATVLGLAHAIMATKLKVRLKVFIPAVENAVSGNAFRPLDVLQTRKGITVEVGNTDAEGRLILCDALAEADTEDPDLLIDMATLTGAARVALGTELPALFCTDDEVAQTILDAGLSAQDPLWRMPLHRPYRPNLKSRVADINNVSSGSFGGAITAALFLNEFISKNRRWVHIDTMAWNESSKPGRPAGGEAFGLRALLGALEARYADASE